MIPRPKFCVGEVVNIQTSEGLMHTKGYEVAEAIHGKRWEDIDSGAPGSGWAYRLANDPDPKILPSGEVLPWAEDCLRKRFDDDNWQNIREIWVPEGEIA
jgi:hypothetical protein